LAISIGSSAGCCHPTVRLPSVDMIEVSERTLFGWSMAMVCTIIPPIETPTTWALSQPRWSISPKASAPMSLSV
jgi:hypothetical protein